MRYFVLSHWLSPLTFDHQNPISSFQVNVGIKSEGSLSNHYWDVRVRIGRTGRKPQNINATSCGCHRCFVSCLHNQTSSQSQMYSTVHGLSFVWVSGQTLKERGRKKMWMLKLKTQFLLNTWHQMNSCIKYVASKQQHVVHKLYLEANCREETSWVGEF